MPNVPVPPKSDHNRMILTKPQCDVVEQTRTDAEDHLQRVIALACSALKNETELKPVEILGLQMMGRAPTGKVSCCPHCMFMLIHTLREAADVFEDIARRLELKEPAFDEWQRTTRK